MRAAGLLALMTGQPLSKATQAVDTQASAARARAIVMEVERQLGAGMGLNRVLVGTVRGIRDADGPGCRSGVETSAPPQRQAVSVRW